MSPQPFVYNRMETYNHLLAEFNAVPPSEDIQQHFKVLSDQLSNNRSRRKLHYLIKKNELKNLLAEQETESSFLSCRPATMSSRTTSSVDRFQLVCSNKSILKREISQIQHQIQFIRKQTNQINNQLQIYEQKREDLEVLRKRSQLDMFNATQMLYIEAANINSEEHREQDIIAQLKKNKGQVAEDISSLVKQKELSQKIIKRWKSTKNVKLKTVKQLGVSPLTLKEMITTLFALEDLKNKAHKKLKYQRRQSYPELSFLKTTNKKSEIIASLSNNTFIFSQNFANQVISFYKELQQEFDRNQRANKQINGQLQALHESHEIVNKELQRAYLHKHRQSQMTLKKYEKTLNQSELSFEQNCKFITFFSTKLFLLLKKLNSLKKSVWNILVDAESLLAKRLIDNGETDKTIQSYEEYLYRNPEEIQIKWNETHTKNEFYINYINHNDLLRTFSCPEGYSAEKGELDNFQTFVIGCSRNINQLIKDMHLSLKAYFKTTQTKIPQIATQKENIQSCKDFCVQSKEYHRRDDFKLLQKMEKNELRKKGLLLQIPFNINAQNQLINNSETLNNDKSFSSLSTTRKFIFNNKMTKYSTLATRRQEQNDLKCSSLRKMLSRLDSFRSKSSSKFINCRSTLNTSFNPNQSIQSFLPPKNDKLSSIRLPRNTVGTMQRVNTAQTNTFK